jgi:hypothetical protein
MATSGRARTRRRWLSLAVAWAFLAAGAGPTAAVDPDIDGSYDTVWTSPAACETAAVPAIVNVERFESVLVRFTLPEGTVYQGSIDAGLNFDVSSKGDEWTGHFTLLSDGGVTMAGNVVYPELSCGGVTLRISVTGKRAETPGSSATEALPEATGFDAGYLVAEEAFTNACVDDEFCDAAGQYGDTWFNAMEADMQALGLSPYGNASRTLHRIAETLQLAAEMGALKAVGPCRTAIFAFPVTHALLLAFGELFVQGVTAAATGTAADLTKIATTADDLLGYTLAADRQALVSAAPCPSAPA